MLTVMLASTKTASVVPIDHSTSSVNVKNAGQDYSYTIQESRGVILDPIAIISSNLEQSAQAASPGNPNNQQPSNEKQQQPSQDEVTGRQANAPEQIALQQHQKFLKFNIPASENFRVIPASNAPIIGYPYGVYYPLFRFV